MGLKHCIKHPRSDEMHAAMKAASRKLRDDVDAILRPVATGKKKRGPKPSGSAKKLLTIRLEPDVIERYRATGKGWQTRMTEILVREAPTNLAAE